MIIFKKILAFILNIILLLLILLLCGEFLIFSVREVMTEKFEINFLHILFISIQYYFTIKIQDKYREKLNKSIIYSKIRFLNVVFLSILLFSSIFIDYSVGLNSIIMFIFFTIFSFLANEMKFYILIQLICLFGIIFCHDFAVVEGLRVKYFIRTAVSFVGIKPR